MGALKDKNTYSLKGSFIKYEKNVKKNCLRMLRLINNLIDITKIDSYAFERILLNLLSNAIKFSNIDGNILVSTTSSEDNVSISIKDTGIGVPNDLKDSIFKRFYKVDNSLSRKTEGSGIGLQSQNI